MTDVSEPSVGIRFRVRRKKIIAAITAVTNATETTLRMT